MDRLTIGQLAARFGLSRSTLLYYDRIGLLPPSARTPAGYRLYSAADVARMELVATYRRAGLPLADIAGILSSQEGLGELLQGRLRQLDEEIQDLRLQQRLIVELLRGLGGEERSRPLDKDRWIEILRSTGLHDDDLRRWHVEFERLAPQGHQEFLESLGLDREEIDRIRAGSKPPAGGSRGE